MSYRDFTLSSLKQHFQLQEVDQALFPQVKKVKPSAWLKKTLAMGLALPLHSEKARSERIVSPILLEVREQKVQQFSIYSGVNLDVDKELGLNGECDFILSRQPAAYDLQSPIFALLEAKDNDIKQGLPQCFAQMLGARLFNQQNQEKVEVIYGCVTTGEIWQFIKLEGNTMQIDTRRFYLQSVADILGTLHQIIDFYQLDIP